MTKFFKVYVPLFEISFYRQKIAVIARIFSSFLHYGVMLSRSPCEEEYFELYPFSFVYEYIKIKYSVFLLGKSSYTLSSCMCMAEQHLTEKG